MAYPLRSFLTGEKGLGNAQGFAGIRHRLIFPSLRRCQNFPQSSQRERGAGRKRCTTPSPWEGRSRGTRLRGGRIAERIAQSLAFTKGNAEHFQAPSPSKRRRSRRSISICHPRRLFGGEGRGEGARRRPAFLDQSMHFPEKTSLDCEPRNEPRPLLWAPSPHPSPP